jgi:hypothetical protein
MKGGNLARGALLHAGNKCRSHSSHSVVVWRRAERLFSLRWHPYAIDPTVDYSKEPTTLVEFRLEEAPGGTLLTVVESGFDRIPVERRAEAYRMNTDGWGIQMENIQRHVAA